MTAKRPLVITDGLPAQLASDETLDATLSTAAIELINTTGEAQALGTPVILKVPNEFELAQGNNRARAEVVGLLKATVSPGITGLVQASGLITAGLAVDWALVTESETNLVPNSVYYLSTTAPGKITNIPPTTEGAYLVRLGKALTTTVFQLAIEPPIGL